MRIMKHILHLLLPYCWHSPWSYCFFFGDGARLFWNDLSPVHNKQISYYKLTCNSFPCRRRVYCGQQINALATKVSAFWGLGSSFPGIMFWMWKASWRGSADSELQSTGQPQLSSAGLVTWKTKPRDGMLHWWKNEWMAPASFPGWSEA